nr:MAG TPA: hypothetical protein [Bacteriophage sp.]
MHKPRHQSNAFDQSGLTEHHGPISRARLA